MAWDMGYEYSYEYEYGGRRRCWGQAAQRAKPPENSYDEYSCEYGTTYPRFA